MRLIRAVGWTSVALGVVDWVMAERFADGVGMPRGKPIFRAAASREVLTGIAAIRAPSHAAPIMARLVGDVVDIGILGATAARPGNPRRRMAVLGVVIVAAVAAVDVIALRQTRSA